VNGAQHIRENGGQVLVQDEPTSVVWGMPGQVAEAGLADAICPLNLIAGELVRRVAVRKGLPPAPALGLSPRTQSEEFGRRR